MIEKQALTDVIDILKPNNFYKDSHKEIYQAIIDLFNNSEPVDLLTVTHQLKKRKVRFCRWFLLRFSAYYTCKFSIKY